MHSLLQGPRVTTKRIIKYATKRIIKLQADVVEEHSSDDMILQNDSNVLRYERYDMFQSRSFRVPKTADLKTISAKYVDGVLTVHIKKREDVMEDKRTVDIE